MCFSAKASIISYGLGMVASTLLFLSKNKFNKHIGLFCLVFVQIQLAEFFMWSDQKCGLMNHYGSVFAHFNLMLQPLSIFIGAYLYQTTIIPNNYLYFLIVLYSFVFIMPIYHHFFKNARRLCSKNISSSYLEWDFNIDKKWWFYQVYRFIYLISLIFSWLLLKDKTKGPLMFGLLLGSIIMANLYSNNKMSYLNNWESIWCFIAVSIPTIMLLIK